MLRPSGSIWRTRLVPPKSFRCSSPELNRRLIVFGIEVRLHEEGVPRMLQLEAHDHGQDPD